MFAIVVTIVAQPGKEEDLIAALNANASHSREEESCLKWEWSRHVEDSSRFAIYEVYTDREAFLAHKASDHFAAWAEASGPCIAEKVAGQYDLSEPDDRSYS
ncbi:MAG: putative quinol monooxygenase [Verrucomicrobiales bacterium]|jgi:quinol monooxygenase YgiN|nr:putative quinol monooxygenase [Verrucomicrobiales bacterium]